LKAVAPAARPISPARVLAKCAAVGYIGDAMRLEFMTGGPRRLRRRESDVERTARLESERAALEQARAQVEQGLVVDGAAVREWLASIGTDHELPRPAAVPVAAPGDGPQRK
jgi:hypothetical protein